MQFECSFNPGVFVERREWNGERSQPLFFNSSVYLLMSSSHVFHESWIYDISFPRKLMFHFWCLFLVWPLYWHFLFKSRELYFNRKLLPFIKTKLLSCSWHETTKPRILLPPIFLSLSSWKRKQTFLLFQNWEKENFFFVFFFNY